MDWNPFGAERRRRETAQQSERRYEERCMTTAKEHGFDLDFTFTPDPEKETLIAELQKIVQKTFWADNPIEGKLDRSDMAPEVRAEYDALIARKNEIRNGHKEELLSYLAPYLPAAAAWGTHGDGTLDQTALDNALNAWTKKYGFRHRDRFFAARSLSR